MHTENKSYCLHKEHVGCISSLPPTPPPPFPQAESHVWPTMPSREQRGYQKSDPGGDHYNVGCLGQTSVHFLPSYEQLDRMGSTQWKNNTPRMNSFCFRSFLSLHPKSGDLPSSQLYYKHNKEKHIIISVILKLLFANLCHEDQLKFVTDHKNVGASACVVCEEYIMFIYYS